MKSLTEYLTLELPARMELLNITPHVEEVVRASGVREGLVLCNAMHITRQRIHQRRRAGLARRL